MKKNEEHISNCDFYIKFVFAIISSFANEILFINNFHLLFSNFSSRVKNNLFQQTKCDVFLLYLFFFAVKIIFFIARHLWIEVCATRNALLTHSLLLWLEQCRLFLMDVRSRFRPFDRGRLRHEIPRETLHHY